MNIKINRNAADERRWITKPGTYDVVVQSAKKDYLPPSADFYVKVTLVTKEGESTFAEIFQRPERDGTCWKLEQWIAATSTDAELDALENGFEVSEASVGDVVERTVGRRLRIKVTEREFTYKTGAKAGQKGIAYNVTSFIKHPSGPEAGPF